MKKNILQKIIIISFFVGMTMLIDYTFNKIFKFKIIVWGVVEKPHFNIIVLFLAGYFLGFIKGFIVCCFYTIWHLNRSFSEYILIMNSLQFSKTQVFSSICLDYIIPDIIVSISGFCLSKKKNECSNKKMFFIFLLILILIRLSFFFSIFFIYIPAMKKYEGYNFTVEMSFYVYSILPFVIDFVVCGLCLGCLKPKLKNISELEYIENIR